MKTMTKKQRENALRNLEKLLGKTKVDTIRALAMTCENELLVSTVLAARESFAPFVFKNILQKKVKCSHCGSWHLIDECEMAIDGGYFCPECIGRATKCEVCEKLSIDPSWHRMCHSCQETHDICRHCDEIFSLTDLTIFDNDPYCGGCLDDITVVCEACGERTLRDDCGQHDGYYYCPDCFEDIDTFDYDSLIQSYSYKPGYPSYGNQRRFGVEMEFEGERSSSKDFMEQLGQYIYLKEDGSIDCGFEVVTKPLLFEKSCEICGQVGAVARENDMKGDNGTCGIHVHVSRGGIENTEETIAKLILLFSRFEDEVSKFARRNSARWAKISKKNKEECVAGEAARLIEIEARERYRAINLANKRTIEFRIFKGTNNTSTIRAIVQFCNAIIDFAEKFDIDHIDILKWEHIFQPKLGNDKYLEMFEYMRKRSIFNDKVPPFKKPRKKRTVKKVKEENVDGATIDPNTLSGTLSGAAELAWASAIAGSAFDFELGDEDSF